MLCEAKVPPSALTNMIEFDKSKELGETIGYRFDWKDEKAKPIRIVRFKNGYREEQFMEGSFNSDEILNLVEYRARLRFKFRNLKPGITEFIISLN